MRRLFEGGVYSRAAFNRINTACTKVCQWSLEVVSEKDNCSSHDSLCGCGLWNQVSVNMRNVSTQLTRAC